MQIVKDAHLCILSGLRYALYAASVYCMSGMTPNDIIYITLPLYHSTGGGTSLGQTLYSGMTTVLARKFSVSGFWSEASRHRVTVFPLQFFSITHSTWTQ